MKRNGDKMRQQYDENISSFHLYFALFNASFNYNNNLNNLYYQLL